MLRASRKNVLEVLEQATAKALTTIPKSFNNHMIWNAGHLLATQQILIYTSSNTSENLDKEFIKKYAKGTFPGDVSIDEIELIKSKLIPSIDQTEEDYANKVFGEYVPRMTSYGVQLDSVEDAISFLNVHEAMHFGQIKMLKKLTDPANL